MREKTSDKASQAEKAAPVFHKNHILTFRRYAGRRDLLSALLKDGQSYTMEQVDRLLQDFQKRSVK